MLDGTALAAYHMLVPTLDHTDEWRDGTMGPNTTDDAATLRGQIVSIAADLSQKRERLSQIERSCQHEWGETVYDPIRHPGSPDRRPTDGRHVPYDDAPYLLPIPPSTEDRWRRTCKQCGNVQYTTRTRPASEQVPHFGG
jgi:hypothetical protein